MASVHYLTPHIKFVSEFLAPRPLTMSSTRLPPSIPAPCPTSTHHEATNPYQATLPPQQQRTFEPMNVPHSDPQSTSQSPNFQGYNPQQFMPQPPYFQGHPWPFMPQPFIPNNPYANQIAPPNQSMYNFVGYPMGMYAPQGYPFGYPMGMYPPQGHPNAQPTSPPGSTFPYPDRVFFCLGVDIGGNYSQAAATLRQFYPPVLLSLHPPVVCNSSAIFDPELSIVEASGDVPEDVVAYALHFFQSKR